MRKKIYYNLRIKNSQQKTISLIKTLNQIQDKIIDHLESEIKQIKLLLHDENFSVNKRQTILNQLKVLEHQKNQEV